MLNYGYQNYPIYPAYSNTNPYLQNSYNQSYNQNPIIPQNNQMSNNSMNNDVNTIQLCDSIDFVKSQNTRLDGQSSYYALTDGSSIYCKKLNPATGNGMLLEYTLKQSDEVKNSVEEKISTMFSDFKMEITKEIQDVKNIVLENLTAPYNVQTDLKKGGEK